MRIILLLLAMVLVSSCTPKVGTEAWCKMMDKKDKGDWTANEAADYAKHCVFK